MTIIEIDNRTIALINELLEVWEDSVKATHLFLSNEEINKIKEYLNTNLKELQKLSTSQLINKRYEKYRKIGQVF